MKKDSGFTIVDLLISIAILGLLSTIVLVNFRGGERSDSVRQSANMALSFLRRAQTMTLSGATLISDGTFPEGGYGVRFDSSDTNTLVLFADKNKDHLYSAGEETESIDLSKQSVFDASGNLDVLFSAPDGEVYFNGAATELSKTIQFSADGTDITKSVIIYRASGQIRTE